MSELIQRKAKNIFSKEIKEDDKKLVRAARAGRIRIIIRLLSTYMGDIDMGCDIDNEPLFEAAKNGHLAIVRLLLDKGAKPNITDGFFGSSPLMAAAGNGHKEVVKLLLDKGADPNMTDWDEDAALHDAAMQKLLMAIEDGNARVIRNYLLSGVNINFDQSKPLKEAVRIGHKDIVYLLLLKGANPNPNMEHVDDESPLTTALKSEEEDLVQILLDAGAVPNEEDKVKMEEWGCFQF